MRDNAFFFFDGEIMRFVKLLYVFVWNYRKRMLKVTNSVH